MKEIGEYLKKLRVSHGVSIEEASTDLKVSVDDLANLEDGITRAFKDIFSMKKLMLDYSKYLGADQDKVLDEFNDFMYEHTSKISLDGLKEALEDHPVQKDNNDNIKSPYTMIPKQRINLKPVLICLVITLIIIIIIYFIFINLTRKEPMTKELNGGKYYEYTNQIYNI